MCTDFTNINKACPKDCYPLAHIDRLVDSSAGYKVMAFGLRTVGATYLLMVNKVFSTQSSYNMEIYLEDMLINSQEAADDEANLLESFKNLRRGGASHAESEDPEGGRTPDGKDSSPAPVEAHPVEYKLRMSIEAQALADFMVKCTHEPVDRAPELINQVEATKERL
ncbi:hypothetical protein LIER_21388 [Lithospermum erythrorhizon]|uniref:Uncharacterized protein n=1 Tax=Lithospermum erythrorhizon TaxID=34254 RepID=A0AAV3QVT1_LITER